MFTVGKWLNQLGLILQWKIRPLNVENSTMKTREHEKDFTLLKIAQCNHTYICFGMMEMYILT